MIWVDSSPSPTPPPQLTSGRKRNEAQKAWRPRTAEHPALDICSESKNLHGALEISGVGKQRQVEYSERLRFQPLVENRYPQLAAPGQKKGGHFERLPNSERAAKGARITQSLLLRRRDMSTKSSWHTQPCRLGTFRNFRHSIPLAGNAALRAPMVINSLQLLPPCQHLSTNLMPPPLHQASWRVAMTMANTQA